MVNFILKRTGSSQLIHVGHSMGNTAFYVMASTKPEMTDKIVAHVSLAPVVYMTHMKSLNVLTPFVEIRKQLVVSILLTTIVRFRLVANLKTH